MSWLIFSVQPNYPPTNNLALLKVLWLVSKSSILEICEDEPEFGMPLGSLGLGSTSTTGFKYPATLQEAKFYESVYENTIAKDENNCRRGQICVDSVTDGTNICTGDHGGPLYELECGTRNPKCLYGVASYYVQDPNGRPEEICTSGSVFTNVLDFKAWIEHTVHFG